MVILNRIYTRTGDDGTTALGDGTRVPKFDSRVQAYGAVDETNAAIGLARSQIEMPASEDPASPTALVDGMLARIQNDLFDLGADLCVPDRGQKLDYEPLRITIDQVSRIEGDIDQLNATLAPLRSFVLPGGTTAAAALHVARTICRRAERNTVALAATPTEPVNDAVIQYLNRLSDFLFVASRFLNHHGSGDVLWVPGKNR